MMPEKRTSKRMTLEILFTIFILFHLLVILVLPNGGSYLGRAFQKMITPYANQLSLNATWNFYAPDPAHKMYVRYNVRYEDASGIEQKESINGQIPAEGENIAMTGSKRRMMYAWRFLTVDAHHMKMLMGPWLCREYPGASTITMENILDPIENLDRAQFSDSEPAQERSLLQVAFHCNEVNEDDVVM